MASRVGAVLAAAAYGRNAVQIMSADRPVKDRPAAPTMTVPLATNAAMVTARKGFTVFVLKILSAELAEAVVTIGASMATMTALVTRVMAASIARVMR